MPADAELSLGSDAASNAGNDEGGVGPALAGDDDRPDLLKDKASLQDAVFGVLFTITKVSQLNDLLLSQK
ncbi:TPA: hypothetical protein ACH3X3_006278 [Trebouxia sp. C0006]